MKMIIPRINIIIFYTFLPVLNSELSTLELSIRNLFLSKYFFAEIVTQTFTRETSLSTKNLANICNFLTNSNKINLL